MIVLLEYVHVGNIVVLAVLRFTALVALVAWRVLSFVYHATVLYRRGNSQFDTCA